MIILTMAAKNTNRNMELIYGVNNSPVLSKKPVIAVAAKKPPKFYPIDDIKKSFVNKHKSKPTKLRLMISNLLTKLRRSGRRKKEKFLLKRTRRNMCFLKRVGLKKKKMVVDCEEEEMWRVGWGLTEF
uniref:60S ribosomal protein L6 n=1 Tax=Solanum tuberosum TaxID=4113 RepID=M1BMN1_SOLTU